MVWINLLKDFISMHWIDLIVLMLFVGVLWTMWVKGYKKQVRKVVYDLVVEAERQLGSGTGEIQRKRVTRWIYAEMPWMIKIFVTENEINGWIDIGFKKLKDFIKNGGNLLTYKEEMELSFLEEEDILSRDEL